MILIHLTEGGPPNPEKKNIGSGNWPRPDDIYSDPWDKGLSPKDYMAEVRRRNAAQWEYTDKVIQDYQSKHGANSPMVFVRPNPGDKAQPWVGFHIAPSTKQAGLSFQATRFDANGPIMDEQFPTLREAVHEILRERFAPIAPGFYDRTVLSYSYVSGMDRVASAQREFEKQSSEFHAKWIKSHPRVISNK